MGVAVFVPVGDASALAMALVRLASDKDRLERWVTTTGVVSMNGLPTTSWSSRTWHCKTGFLAARWGDKIICRATEIATWKEWAATGRRFFFRTRIAIFAGETIIANWISLVSTAPPVDVSEDSRSLASGLGDST